MRFAAKSLISITTWAKNLSLDAPLVAVTWVEILRRGYSSQHDTPPTVIALLVFATVWLIYMFDRLMDVRTLTMADPTNHRFISDRHRFARRYQRILWPIWIVVGTTTVAAAFAWMDDDLRRTGLIHLGGVAFYFLFVHGQLPTRLLFPKEVVVGVLFALGVSMTVAPPWTWTFAMGVVLLAALFTFNCLIVARDEVLVSRGTSLGESPGVAAQGTRPIAQPSVVANKDAKLHEVVAGRTASIQGLVRLGAVIASCSVLLMLVSDLPRLICVCACASAGVSSWLCYWPKPGGEIRNDDVRTRRDWSGSGNLADAVLVAAPLTVVALWPVLGLGHAGS